jgi:hypothetical protein
MLLRECARVGEAQMWMARSMRGPLFAEAHPIDEEMMVRRSLLRSRACEV